MTKRMLIDATHAEETRVVVLDGNRLEDFDVETSTKRQLKGNIYLAKVVRVEPSLQAAFVEYGGNRHGFLAFSEIHPDYYQIPVADRQRLIELEAEEAEREEAEADLELALSQREEAAVEQTPAIPAETAGADTLDESGVAAEMVTDFAPSTEPAEPEAPALRLAGEPAVELEARTEPVAPNAHEAAPLAEPPEPASAIPEAAVPSEWAAAAQPAATPDEEPRAEATQPVAAAAGAADETRTEAETPAMAPPEPLADPATALAAREPASTTTGEEPNAAATPSVPPAESRAVNAAGEDAAPATAAAPVEPAPPSTASPPPEAPDQPDEPNARRAQPLIIESETITGPAETGDEAPSEDAWRSRDAESSADAQPASDETVTVDTESDEDLIDDESVPETPPPETVGGEPDTAEEQRERRIPPRFLRNYKIQEVIRRRQILLVQVVKEERGTKGAALTTYLSLAGRFSVLMPNSPRGGGISRKITSATDRRRLKEVITELDIPKGMGMIVRTAGANRPKPEIKRDCEYLLRLWDDIREHTLKSVAPALIYEEASLIKRAIRDVYSRDIDEIQVDGEDGWRAAHEFMRMLMPSHARKVQLWRDPSQPLFGRYQVEAQLDAMLQPIVQLRSGGYLVINQTEALVAIDVNSGRSTRERNVEETALRTNLEAADEVARQLRLRDLAGLIVIDFIDMESKKHNAMVERRLKEALKNDRARIQVGHISHFGLMEMSRQRLRPSLAEASFILCPHCGGTGHVRSTETAAVHVLRGIEEEGSKRRAAEIVVHAATPIALYILNHKRERLREIEQRYAMRVTVLGDDTQVASQYRIDRVRPQVAREGAPPAITPDLPPPPATPEPNVIAAEEPDIAPEEEEVGVEEAAGDEAAAEVGGEAEAGQAETADGADEQGDHRRRRRRRRRGGRRDEGASQSAASDADAAAPAETPSEEAAAGEPEAKTPEISAAVQDLELPEAHIEGVPEHAEPAGEDENRRRRGRRGGRRRRREAGEGEASPFAVPGAEQPDLPPVYLGPTPANPFGGQAFDIFDVLEQAEANAAAGRQETGEPMVQRFQPEPAPAPVVIAPGGPEAADEAAPATPAEAEGVAAPMPEVAAPSAEATAAPSPEVVHEAGPEIVNVSAPEPGSGETVAEPAAIAPIGEPAVAEPFAAEPAPAPEPESPQPEPVVRPIVIGGDQDPAGERKRGWWRR